MGVGGKVSGVPLARDTAVLEAGFDLRASRDVTIGLAYSGQYGSGVQSNAVSAKLNWRF
ncbi:autotransporter outer membrane beta-barrel domain-containing protein [Achromobacter seleniivolatilans]|uniref:Autotransporter outer membrane beta-barrel domain-containing protein n=1 Tax=Achromobacter seleniivolatilans TaxID=3047478 RepID=A0ABY9M802_9BURK|nr:autotransporter outer membrane beta-barrel domain-containing protein [Achromobacter sp. R39]WMD21932.1 autotransporter outer membrane beta-barrel domain-containing protein [Achromobacter sp. R39]